MKKRFILMSLICVLTFGFVQPMGMAVSYTDSDVMGFLTSAGIFSDVQIAKADEEISRIDFAVFAAKMIGINETGTSQTDYFYDIPTDHWGKYSVNALVERSIISGDGQRLFRPDDTITLSEAAVILTRIIHKDREAEFNGGYPYGYLNIASQYDIITSSMSANQALTYKDAANIIFNTLNAEVEFLGTKDTLLSKNYDIYAGEGQVRAVYGASISELVISDTEQVAINGEIFRTETPWLYDRLGVYVKYYYRLDNGDKTIVYVSEDNDKKNEIIKITSELYEGYSDGRVDYYEDETMSRMKRADISDGVVVIRNGVNVSDNLQNAFRDFYGYMTLIQSKGSSDVDVVIIEDYENIAVGYINQEDKILADANDTLVSMKLDDETCKMVFYQDADGNEADFDKISVGDVVSIAKSDDNSFVKVIINSGTVMGVAEGTKTADDSVYIVIDGTDYEFESRFYQKKHPVIVIGETVTVKTDLFGKVADGSFGNKQNYKFAYLIKGIKDDIEEKLLIKLYTEDNEMLTLACAEKVKIDAVRYTDNTQILDRLSVGGEVKSQLVRFKCNAENEIVEIDTKESGTGENKNSLHLMKNEKNIYRHWTNLLGYNAYVPTSVKVMVVPEEGTEKSASDDRFQIKNITAVPSGTTSRVDIYQLDENSLTVDFVVYYTAVRNKVDTYAALNVVEEVTTGLNSEEEPTTFLKLDNSGTGVSYAISPNYVASSTGYSNIDPSRIARGDIVRISTDHKNEITSMDLVFDYSKAKESGNYNFFDTALNPGYKVVNGVPVGNFFDGFKMSYGYVSRTEGNLVQWGYEKPGDADEIYNVTFDSNKAKILIYDDENRTDPCRIGTVKDIVGYYSSAADFSKIVALSRSAIISQMVVYK